MKKIAFKLLSLGFIALSLSSCSSVKESIDKKVAENHTQSLGLTLVLCHGLWADSKSLVYIEYCLNQDFKNAHIINHQKINTHKSLTEQSNILFTQLCEKHKIEKKGPILLIGHSQGGLRAYLTAKKLKNNGYNVVGVVTIGTPWEGTPLLQASSLKELDNILDSDQNKNEFLGMLSRCIPRSARRKLLGHESCGRNKIMTIQKLKDEKHQSTKGGIWGILEMIPGNEELKRLQKNLQDNNIPVLAIGGRIDNSAREHIRKLIPRYSSKKRNHEATIDKFLDRLIGTKEHDLLVPLESQLARNISKKNFDTCIYPATHFLLIDNELPSELWSGNIVRKVVEFVQEKTK